MTLGELFNFYGSDKEDNHGYSKYYERHLPKSINKLCEIGVWKAGGILAFQQYYDYIGEFHVINHVFGGEIISKKQLERENIIPHECYQQDIECLKTVKDIFTVVCDDGSHNSADQIISFKQLFLNNTEFGGLYVIEDIFGHVDGDEGKYWRGERVNSANDTIMNVVKRWQKFDSTPSQFFTEEENELFISIISEINIYEDKIIFLNKA